MVGSGVHRMIGSVFIVLDRETIPNIETVQTWGRTFITETFPGIIEFSDNFPGGLLRFTGPLKVKNEGHAGIKISCVEPRVFKLLVLSLSSSKKKLAIKHMRLLEKKEYTDQIRMTFGKGILTRIPFKDTLFKKTCEAYNLLYAKKLETDALRKSILITKTNTTVDEIDRATLIKGYLEFQLKPGPVNEQTLQEFLYFIETHGLGLSKDKGYGNIRCF
jgi:hypothetical protein